MPHSSRNTSVSQCTSQVGLRLTRLSETDEGGPLPDEYAASTLPNREQETDDGDKFSQQEARQHQHMPAEAPAGHADNPHPQTPTRNNRNNRQCASLKPFDKEIAPHLSAQPTQTHAVKRRDEPS